MGYYSDVGIALYTKDYNKMLKKARGLKDKNILNFIKQAERYVVKEEPVTILKWTWIKWYPEFNHVSWITNFIEKVDSAIVRLGESINDNEEDSYLNGSDLLSYMYYNREICIDGAYQYEEDENLNELLDEIDRRL